MLEAFKYAAAHDYCYESPQYDDNGDGISHAWSMLAGTEGLLGADTYLSGGTVTPLRLNFTRTSDALVLSWSGDYQLLTATNVCGPYSVVIDASSPFTNRFTAPQQYFQLR